MYIRLYTTRYIVLHLRPEYTGGNVLTWQGSRCTRRSAVLPDDTERLSHQLQKEPAPACQARGDVEHHFPKEKGRRYKPKVLSAHGNSLTGMCRDWAERTESVAAKTTMTRMKVSRVSTSHALGTEIPVLSLLAAPMAARYPFPFNCIPFQPLIISSMQQWTSGRGSENGSPQARMLSPSRLPLIGNRRRALPAGGKSSLSA